jgi:hypothetical protein
LLNLFVGWRLAGWVYLLSGPGSVRIARLAARLFMGLSANSTGFASA